MSFIFNLSRKRYVSFYANIKSTRTYERYQKNKVKPVDQENYAYAFLFYLGIHLKFIVF